MNSSGPCFDAFNSEEFGSIAAVHVPLPWRQKFLVCRRRCGESSPVAMMVAACVGALDPHNQPSRISRSITMSGGKACCPSSPATQASITTFCSVHDLHTTICSTCLTTTSPSLVMWSHSGNIWLPLEAPQAWKALDFSPPLVEAGAWLQAQVPRGSSRVGSLAKGSNVSRMKLTLRRQEQPLHMVESYMHCSKEKLRIGDPRRHGLDKHRRKAGLVGVVARFVRVVGTLARS